MSDENKTSSRKKSNMYFFIKISHPSPARNCDAVCFVPEKIVMGVSVFMKVVLPQYHCEDFFWSLTTFSPDENIRKFSKEKRCQGVNSLSFIFLKTSPEIEC